MRTLLKQLIFEFIFVFRYFRSALFGYLTKNKYKNIQSFCLFIGYPRSGHSLIASLLDAHPNMVIGMEWGVLSFIKQFYKQKQIFYSLWKHSVFYKTKKNNTWTGYSYKVPNSWQGRFKDLKVIGDKKGGRASMLLFKNPELLPKLEKTVKLKLKIIHVIRNPFDVITTMTFRRHERLNLRMPPEPVDLLPYINTFFTRADVVLELLQQNRYEIYSLYNEQFISNPKEELKHLFDFLNVHPENEYLDNCCSIVYKEPHQSRNNAVWNNDLISFVEEKIRHYPFLKHYRFSD